jgi:hypothetical protein
MIFLAYLATALACWIPFAVGIVLHNKRTFPTLPVETEDYAFGVVFGAFFAVFWPLVLVVLAMVKVVRQFVEADEQQKAAQ